MSNVVKNSISKNVHSHIDQSFEIIDNHLPSNYVALTLGKLLEYKTPLIPSKRAIRNIRNKGNGYRNQVHVIKALVEVALDNKKIIEEIKELVKS